MYYVLLIIGLIGFLIMFGSVGASDLELISIERLVIQSSIGMLLVTVSLIGLKIGGYEHGNKRGK